MSTVNGWVFTAPKGIAEDSVHLMWWYVYCEWMGFYCFKMYY